MNFSKRSIGSIVLVVALVLSALTAGSMAATVDTETTVTATQSELTTGTTIVDYAGEPLANGDVEANVTSTDPAFRVIDGETGMVVDTFSGTDLNQTGSVDTGTDGNADAWYYRTNVSEAFQKVPINAGENKTVAIKIVDDRTLDEANETYTWLNVTVDGVADRAIFAGTDDALTFDQDGWSVLGFDLSVDDNVEWEQTDVGVNGSGSTVSLRVTNATGADRFATSADGLSSGDWIWTSQLWINETPHKVYYESAPDDVDSSATYGVYDPTDDTVTAHLGDDYDGESYVDMRVVGNDAYDTLTRFQHFGVTNALGSLWPF
jgi:hypothetical protein